MAMSIKNKEVERLAGELARLTNSSKTEAIRQALREKKERVTAAGALPRKERLRWFLEQRVWPEIPPEASRPWSKEEEDTALGFGEHGEPV